ncbi:Major facilitator superfamily domain-containing protein 6 [Habropoda laboriosa]|uniref:Major facilitator superfamily domain-containing protein 6 n=1 Tax=Habropoda laboriosa TaxID=597456 RepID=A0A0L7QYM4_9HYME|nr:Major facilitator superfamily domain-containing protein 6 [Habropoda laboriosa]
MMNYGLDDGYDFENENREQTQEEQAAGGRSLPQLPRVRPILDPNAQGEVDPTLYPPPTESTHKIRGKSDVIEYLFGAVDQELLTVKTFYFFFYSAFGSLFPLMGVYFKQMGMNAGQCGLLMGLRPFIEFVSAPIWGSWADRWQKGKVIFLASLSCWILFTLPLAFMQPPATSCLVARNQSVYLEYPNPQMRIIKRSTSLEDFYHRNDDECLEVAENVVFKRIRKDDDSLNPDTNINFLRNKGTLTSNIQRDYDLNNNRIRREIQDESTTTTASTTTTTTTTTSVTATTTTEESPVEDLKYKQLVFEENNPEAKTIDFETLQRKNRPADVLEYKRFLNNQPLDDGRPPKKAYTHTKTRVKPPPTKVMVKRDVRDEDLNTPRKPPVKRYVRIPHSGQSPHSVSYAANYNEKENRGWVKPLFSSIVYRQTDIQKTFFLLLLLVIVGEFFSAPAITLADSAVITLLGEDADRYGHQRMFGSLGWGLAMFFVGIALDHSTAFSEHPCGPDLREKNYTICFAIFSVLMGVALITATQINFKYEIPVAEPEVEKPPAEPTREEQLQSQLSQQLNLPSLQDSSAGVNLKPQPPEGKTKMFAQTTREIPEWVAVLKQFKDLKCLSFLFVAWFMGFGVLCMGLGGNVLRFLYISWLTTPWWVLPFEFIQGITHAAVWAACCSYIAHNTPPQLRTSAQGVLQGIHHGLGRGCGAVIGGMLVDAYGTSGTFRVYGLSCLIVLAGFVFINFYRKDTGFVSELPQTEDPHQVAEATHLAPHGVPSNAIPRALSSTRLHELANQDTGYGATYQTADGSLGVPGASGGAVNPTNPFLNGGSGGGEGGYNYGMTGNGEDEYIRRSFQLYNEVVSRDLDLIKPPPIVTHLHAQQPCTNPFHQHDYEW